ncbi:hypothetical protein BUALT_Bualt05G0072600 [Buddleja alternifolia]|uniref:Transposase Tnp1/En/Spm-like domain-containing protein n=1 Tax=Buddleja alternifolia TaxID=168488 RepID=A0AAV6XP61_9LAMI|nr:hypothetical protein BUALT_Bualt05G0072600 [Buddleja alternifolia]
MSHRRFFSGDHPYRKDAKSFDGNEEIRSAPRPLTGDMVLEELTGFDMRFGKKVENMHLNGNPVSNELRALAQGPNPVWRRYRGFIVNGFRFHVKKFEKRRRTQNSGLVVTAQTSSYASRNDANPIVGDVTYYGMLKDIIELDYFEGGKIVLFECDWVSPGRAQKQDETGFTLANFSRSRQHNEPFVLASQAQQIFYIEDPIEKGWHVVMRAKAMDSFDMDPILSLDGGTFQYIASNDGQLHAGDEKSNWIMPPRTRPRTKRPRHEVLEQRPQVSGLESTRHGATQTQSDSGGDFNLYDAAIVQSNLNRNTRDRATKDITSTQDNPIDVETEQVGNKRKGVRGPTCMPKNWGQQPDELVAVSFNDLRQPNDEFKTCTLSHFLGTIARNGRYCPLHYKDWRLMSHSYKGEMLKIAKFELQPGKEPYILKSINKKWRNWKSYVKSLNFDPNIPIEQQMLDIPSQVDEDQYKALVKHWMSDKSKIMGQDKHGYLRMYGVRVTPANVCGAIPGRDASYRLAMKCKSKNMEAVEKFDALNAKVESLSALVNGRAQSVGQLDGQNIPLLSSNNQRSSASMSRPMHIRVHSRVVLKSLRNINEIVASGYVSEMEYVKVNGEELGSDWCEIVIQSQVKKDVRLLKPYGNIKTIEDTLGALVAWPLSLECVKKLIFIVNHVWNSILFFYWLHSYS